MKFPTDRCMVDLLVKTDTVIKDGWANDNVYAEEGYGSPEFNTLESAIEFINLFKMK